MQDSLPIRGLHHVTATVANAQRDLDFYVGLLGLRLIKKTINFDNSNVYHLYYGNERGDPSTLMTTFPYEGWGVPPGVQGAGQITATAVSVPEGSLGIWRERMESRGIALQDAGERFGDEWISVLDPSGLVIELVATAEDERSAWVTDEIPEQAAPRGIFGITMTIRQPTRTMALLTDALGWAVVNETASRARLVVGQGGAGRTLDVLHSPDAPQAINGLGTVHHVAMAVDDEETQLVARERLLSAGLRVTEVLDRQYFKSIYFREPGGVLYEIATLGPGFLVDEELEDLGKGLRLPPWEEPHRDSIERQLSPIRY